MLIEAVYLSTSKKVLDIVKGPHKLLEHLKAMRNYLLLGQGDFIGMLMENLKYLRAISTISMRRMTLSLITGLNWTGRPRICTVMSFLPFWMQRCDRRTPSTTIQRFSITSTFAL